MPPQATEPERGRLGYGVGASLVLWYLPLIGALFVGPVAQSDNARALWLTYFAILPGALFKSLTGSGEIGIQVAIAGAVAFALLVLVAVLWIRLPRRRGVLALVTLALSIANTWILAPLFAL